MERALYYSMVRFSPSIEQRKQGINCEANDVGLYRRLLTNHGHGRAAYYILNNYVWLTAEITV